MERVIGLTVAVTVNVLLAWLLLRAADPAKDMSVRGASALQVVWIDAAMERVADVPQSLVPKRSRPRGASSAARAAAGTTPEIVAATDASASRNEQAEKAALPLDLTLADGSATLQMAFARSNAMQPSADEFAARDRLGVEVRDRLIGGSLARMARASDCAELRAAMRGAAAGRAGLDVILKSMQSRGCR